ncbi:MAG: SEC-C metal-binding domain-containing protein [Planctomycetota bacterium]
MVVFDVDRAESGDGSSLAGSFVVTLPSLRAIDAATENGLLPDAAALRALWQRALAEQPELVAQLEARRQKMKTLTPPRGSQPAPARRRAVPGRNDPCPCGSGKKWKKCCGA